MQPLPLSPPAASLGPPMSFFLPPPALTPIHTLHAAIAAVTSRCQFGPADAFLRAVKGLSDDPQKAEAAYKRALLLAGVWHFPVELVDNLEVWRRGSTYIYVHTMFTLKLYARTHPCV